MIPAHRRSPLLVAGIVAVALAGRLVLSTAFDAPWVAPDEMLYALLGESVWEDARYEVLGVGTPYYGLYGLVPGGLVAALGPSRGVLATQVLQMLAVGSTGIVAFVWARRVASPGWAVAAAALALVLPGLDLAGLMMTESFFVATVTLALFAMTVAITRPTPTTLLFASGAILLAAQIRTQGLLLIPVFAAGAIATASLLREARILRTSAPALAGLGIWAVAWLAGTQSEGGALGAYSPVLSEPPSVADGIEWVVWHAADVVVMVAAVPLIATIALGILVVRRIERDRDVIALAVTSIGWLAVSVVSVGLFASQHVGHVAGRDLLSVAPALFVGFAAWASRRAWRRGYLTAAVAVPAGLLVAIAPENVIAPVTSSPDALELVPLWLLSENASGLVFRVVIVAALVAVTGALLLLARAGSEGVAALTVVLVGALSATSAVAAHRVDSRSEFDRAEFFGDRERSWIDRTIGEPTVLLDSGSFFWNDFWHQAFWNDDVTGVASMVADDPARPLPGRLEVRLYDDGTLRRADGTPLVAGSVVADELLTLAAEPHARIRRQRLPDLVGWRTGGTVALSARLRGVELGGESSGPFEVEVFHCDGGTLWLRVRAEVPTTLAWTVQAGEPHSRAVLPGQWRTLRFALERPPVPAVCIVALHSSGTLTVGPVVRSPVVRRARPEPDARPVFDSPAVQPADTEVGYCVEGVFALLGANEPRTDPAYRGAAPAFFVDGVGLACRVPRGFRSAGYAGPPQGVPDGLYPYFVRE